MPFNGTLVPWGVYSVNWTNDDVAADPTSRRNAIFYQSTKFGSLFIAITKDKPGKTITPHMIAIPPEMNEQMGLTRISWIDAGDQEPIRPDLIDSDTGGVVPDLMRKLVDERVARYIEDIRRGENT